MSAPGWYPDPSGNGGMRYFNGNDWSEYRRPPNTPPPKQSNTGKVVLFSILGVVLFFAGCGALLAAGSSEDDTGDTASSVAPLPPPSPADDGRLPGQVNPTGGIGEEVRDGKFAFVVSGIYKQEGFVTVHMQVTNIGDRAQTFFPQNQKLIDMQGREYEADTMAVYDFNDDGIIELNPGLSTEVVVPFQAPPGTQFSAIELHDSAFSGGVRVVP